MSTEFEIERKFLVEMPDVSCLNVLRTMAITQTYLENGENGSQRRVRRICENGSVSYTYTEKIFLTGVTRKETEYEISRPVYDELLAQARRDRVPIEKLRRCFDHNGQLFELDAYPFSDSLAIMEIELDSPGQSIDFPENIKVIAEVSDDERYSNASLAMAGAFPEQIGENF